jgi:uncharacterized membrane protein
MNLRRKAPTGQSKRDALERRRARMQSRSSAMARLTVPGVDSQYVRTRSERTRATRLPAFGAADDATTAPERANQDPVRRLGRPGGNRYQEHAQFAERALEARKDVMQVLRAGTLVVATMAMGIMAGAFQLYAYAIMPGLGRTDDRTFVGAFQSIDRAIINPLFMLAFLGALVFTGVAAVTNLGTDGRTVLPWVLIALVLYLIVFVITIRINVPLNDGIKAAGAPDRIADLAAVRQRFDEARWNGWNIVRAVLSTVAFACLAWALVLYGRGTPGGA